MAGECWFPGDPPEEMNVSIVGGDAASERTKSTSACGSSFVRSVAPAKGEGCSPLVGVEHHRRP